MLFNSVSGVCERRLILNWRVDPAAVQKHLPRSLSPRLVDGKAIVGVDFMKLSSMRPTGFPGFAGFSTENAIDRIAVEWTEGGAKVQGLYVPYRYSPSAVNTIVSVTRLFPTIFTFANFQFSEKAGLYRCCMLAGSHRFDLEARESKNFAQKSVFKSIQAASDFHRDGKISYSPSAETDVLDGLYLKSLEWSVKPLEVEHVHYSYIQELYPKAVFDSGLIMRDTRHEWHGLGSITVAGNWVAEKEKKEPTTSASKGPARVAAQKKAVPSKKPVAKKSTTKRSATGKTAKSGSAKKKDKSAAKKSTRTGR